MTSHEFICQDPEVLGEIFMGLVAHLRNHDGINVTHKRYVGNTRIAKTDVAAWLLFDKDNNARFYVEYNADKNELNCRRINILEIDYRIPEPKEAAIPNEYLRSHLEEFLDKGWYSLIEDIDKKQADTLKRLREQLNGKPQPTLKSMINSSMDEIMSELASMKQKAQPTMNKMERVYKAMMTELSKDG